MKAEEKRLCRSIMFLSVVVVTHHARVFPLHAARSIAHLHFQATFTQVNAGKHMISPSWCQMCHGACIDIIGGGGGDKKKKFYDCQNIW